MQVAKSRLANKQMVKVLSALRCHFLTDEDLIRSNLRVVIGYKVNQKAGENRLFLSLFGQSINDLNGLLNNRK